MEVNTKERFAAVDDDYIKFERILNKRNKRPDLHAFLLLDEIFPGGSTDMVCAASHDVIYLDIDSDKLVHLTDESILELTRCGVMYDSESDSLSMFT